MIFTTASNSLLPIASLRFYLFPVTHHPGFSFLPAMVVVVAAVFGFPPLHRLLVHLTEISRRCLLDMTVPIAFMFRVGFRQQGANKINGLKKIREFIGSNHILFQTGRGSKHAPLEFFL